MKKGHQRRGRLYGRGGPVVGLGSDKSVGQRSSGGLRSCSSPSSTRPSTGSCWAAAMANPRHPIPACRAARGDRRARSEGERVVRLREYYRDTNAPRAHDVLPAAFAAVRNVTGEVLLVRRIDDGNWELPGGRIDVGESAAQAVIREVAEESGVSIAVIGLSGVYSDPTHVLLDPDGTIHQQLALCFHAVPAGPDDTPAGAAGSSAPRSSSRSRATGRARRRAHVQRPKISSDRASSCSSSTMVVVAVARREALSVEDQKGRARGATRRPTRSAAPASARRLANDGMARSSSTFARSWCRPRRSTGASRA